MTDHIDQRNSRPIGDIQRFWSVMTFYERFEQIISLVLTTLIAAIIIVALWDLMRQVFFMLLSYGQHPLDHGMFQTVFGMILTLLIALEFKHSILRVLERREHIVQVRTVILIALLAMARKFIILDMSNIHSTELAALGFSSLTLGLVYWLIREH
ncbi:phosphate-starvation-inducible PsiE family protein [Thiomonas sp.]